MNTRSILAVIGTVIALSWSKFAIADFQPTLMPNLRRNSLNL